MEVLQDTYKDTIFRRLLGNIPKDWNIKEISDFTKFSQGVQVNVELQSSSPSNELIRFIRIVDYTQSTDDIRYVSKSYKKYIVNENDIVMIRYGTPGVIGRNIKGVIANNMFKISIDNSLASNDYFEYFFKQKHIQEYLLMGSGSSTMPALNFSYLKKFQIALPPLPEQQKIAAILSTVDEQISTTDKIIEKSKELKKSLMQKLFSKGIGHTEYDSPQGGIFRKILGKTPSDWVIKEISKIAVFTQGVQVNVELQDTSQTDINIRFIRIVDYTQNTNDVRYVSNTFSKYAVKKDDIVMVRYGTPGIIGRGIEGVIANNMFKIKLDNTIVTNDFFECFFSQSKIQEYLIMGSGSSTMPALNFSYLKKFQIALPAIQEQHKIVGILSEADAKIEKEQTQKAQLEALKKGLMQQLLTGKIRVTV